LEYVFKTYGKLEDIKLMEPRGDIGRAFAFVAYANADDAAACLRAMEDGYEIKPGQGNIIVKYPDSQRPPSGTGGRSRPY